METGKPELASAAAHMSSVVAQTERRMEIQAPLTAVYIHTVPALPSHPLPQPPLAVADPSVLHLSMPPLYSKETLPFLTLHIASGLQPGLSMTASSPAAKPKSAGKHLCPHCGRDCMKPSVLEKHVRCHTGERPYPCTICGVSFKTQSNLYKHKRTQAHARLSSESEHSTQGSVGSMDSLSHSTETTSLSVDERSDECIGAERDANLATEKTPDVTQTLEINEKSLSSKGQEQAKLSQPGDKLTTDRPPSSNRHVVLQRQEATLFSKQWESSVSSSKSQSHESTDSGFSESSEHYPSPAGSLLLDHSMDSLTETTAEHGEESASQKQEDKNAIKEQENKSLEERITKLISQNSAVVEDKHLENVRPRKTALSKQGSIDLPMPYTYKDSFHFDMRINKMSNTQRNRRPGLYNSVPTQQSSSVEHAPLTRSNSLPFSVNLLQPDRSSPTYSSYHQDYTTLFRRGSSGQINPTSFSMKSVNQQSSTHRPLVRQAAVDCNHATDALCKNSSVEEAGTGSLSCHGEAGDICGDTSSRKFRRKKAQKFAYNKWYMYGGGTFKKLYEMERGGENRAAKGTKSLPNPEVIQSLQKHLSAGHCETTVESSPSLIRSATVHNLETYAANLQLLPSVCINAQTHTQSHILASSTTQKMPLRRNLSLSVLPLSFLSLTPNLNIDTNKSEASNFKNPCSVSQSHVNVPSDRKKQKTDEKLCPRGMETEQSLPQPQLNKINIEPNSTQVSLFSTNTININALPVTNSPATSGTTAAQNSFMPKYQLKLPNSQESDSRSSIQVGSKLAQDNIASVSTSASTVTTTESKKSDTLIWTHQNITSSNCRPLLSQSMPCTASHMNVFSPLVHQCPMADTKTTSSLRNSNAGQFSTTIQSSPFGALGPTTMKNSVSFTPIHRTQSSPAAFTAFVQTQQHEAPQKSSTSSLRPQSALNPDTNIPVIPCQLVPGQQTVPNVFHVQTPDLQICFQIISDEQLALIEPQIEKQTGSKQVSTEQMHAVAEGVKTSTTVESTDKQTSHSHHVSNKEVDTLNKVSAKPSICDKSEKEWPTVHMSQPIGQPPALSTHPHICSQVNKVAKDGTSVGEEVSAVAPPKENISEINKNTPKNLFCKVAAQDHHLSEVEESRGELVSQTSDENITVSATVTCTPISPVNSGGRKCEENQTKIRNEDLCFRNSNETVTRTNLQLSMVSLSLSQTNKISDKMGLSDGPALAHEAGFKQTSSVTPVSTEDAKAAVANVPELSTGLKEGGSAVGCVELQSHRETPEHKQPEQSQEPPHTDREGFTYSQKDTQVQETTARVDSFPNGCLSGQQHLQHLSQTQLGMCECPPQSPGTDPNLQSSSITANTDICSLPPTSLVKTNSYVQHMGTVSVLSQPNKAPQNKIVSEVGFQEAGQFQQQDQRQDSGADNAMINSTTHMIADYMSQSHTNEPRESYLSNSSVYVNTSRQANTVFSEHLCQDKPPLPCDKFPLLFGMGHSFSYPPADTLSGAVRVVQSSMEGEDSSSDDEGKLIIEL